MYVVTFRSSAAKEFKMLPRIIRDTIYTILEKELAQDPYARTLDVKKLKAPFLGYRLRVRDYRILYEIDGQEIVIYSVKHRKDVYR